MQKLELNRVYRHFKGDYYLTVDTAQDAETEETYVIYRKLYEDGSLWIRKESEFLGEVDREKYTSCTQRYRFELQEIPSVRSREKE